MKNGRKGVEKVIFPENCFVRIPLLCTFATAKRCVSSVWLEYMPVTHGVTGSSPVRTANLKSEIKSVTLTKL